jgi:hypothetical protein
MATTTPGLHDALVQAGVHEDAAARIARGCERRPRLSASSILVATVIGGFWLLAVGIGWVRSNVQDLRSGLRAEVAANRERSSALGERVSALEIRMSERLTRIETLLEERLPERR